MIGFLRYYANEYTARVLFGQAEDEGPLVKPATDWDVFIDSSLPNGFFYTIPYKEPPGDGWQQAP